MAVDFSKLWKLLIDKKMNKSQLKEAACISTNAIAKLGKNEKKKLTFVKGFGIIILALSDRAKLIKSH